MRILEIETFGRGGLIHYAYNLSCALAERGHDVTLLTTAGYELEGKTLPDNVRILKILARITQGEGGAWRFLPTALVRKIEALVDAVRVAFRVRRLDPDVIHLHSTNPIALVYVALLRNFRGSLVVTAHVVTPHERSARLDAVHGWIHRLSTRIVAHSDSDRARLVNEFGIEPERIAVIPHGEYGFFERAAEETDRASARRRLGLEPSDEVALFFGYIREYKGLDLLLEAWTAVHDARSNARLVVAGDPVRLEPSRHHELETWAARLGAVHRFEYIPFEDVHAYFEDQALMRKVFQNSGGGQAGGRSRGNETDYRFGGNFWVVIDKNGAHEFRNVRTGITDLDRVEIISGIDESDTVLILPSSHLVETQQDLQNFINRRVGGRTGHQLGSARC